MGKKRSEMTPEELEKARAWDREYKRMVYSNMTPYEKAKLRSQRRARRENKKAQMSLEEIEKKRQKNRDYMRGYKRKRLALMSPQERDDYWKSLYEEKKFRKLQRRLNSMGVKEQSHE